MQWMGFDKLTIKRWEQEGFPGNTDPYEYFGLERVKTVPVSVYPFPERKEIPLEETSEYKIIVDNRGLTQKLYKDETIPYANQFIDFPIKNRDDLKVYQKRLNTSNPVRYDLLRSQIKVLTKRDYPLGLVLRGNWELRYFLGFEQALLGFYEQPDLISDMLELWFRHQWSILETVCGYIDLDFVLIWEDLCHKTGAFISPDIYRNFFAKYHRGTAEILKKHQVSVFLVDCDGHIDELLPLFMENGITGTFPLECNADADPIKFRHRYKNVQLVGGIDKTKLMAGEREIAMELENKLKSLLPHKGYIPSLDHCVPPEIPLANFRYYVKRLKEMAKEAVK